MYTRITVVLDPSEKEALIRLALKELRHPQAQAAFIIRQDLERRGMLPGETDNQQGKGSNGKQSKSC